MTLGKKKLGLARARQGLSAAARQRPDQKQKLASLVLVTRTSEEWGVGVGPCSCLLNVRSALHSPDQIIRIRLLFQQKTGRPIIHSHATYAQHPCFSPNFFYPLLLFWTWVLRGKCQWEGEQMTCIRTEALSVPAPDRGEGVAWPWVASWHVDMQPSQGQRNKDFQLGTTMTAPV